MAELTKLDKEDFKKILENFNIGKFKSYKHIYWALGNTVYFLNTSKGKYVLKVFERENPTLVEFQVKVMDYVEKHHVPSPKIMKTKKGKLLHDYKKKKLMIQSFVDGKPLKRLNEKVIKDIAKKHAHLNKSLLKLKPKRIPKRRMDRQFKKRNLIQKKYLGFDIQKNADQLYKDVKQIKRSKLRQCIIHSDFHSLNLLIKKNKLVGIIDWDDVRGDYLATEVAVFIGHTFITKGGVRRNYLKLYLKEFQKHLKLNNEEKKAIYYFIKSRYVGALDWSLKQWRNHPDQRHHIEVFLSRLVSSYTILNKISLEEFMKFY